MSVLWKVLLLKYWVINTFGDKYWCHFLLRPGNFDIIFLNYSKLSYQRKTLSSAFCPRYVHAKSWQKMHFKFNVNITPKKGTILINIKDNEFYLFFYKSWTNQKSQNYQDKGGACKKFDLEIIKYNLSKHLNPNFGFQTIIILTSYLL